MLTEVITIRLTEALASIEQIAGRHENSAPNNPGRLWQFFEAYGHYKRLE